MGSLVQLLNKVASVAQAAFSKFLEFVLEKTRDKHGELLNCLFPWVQKQQSPHIAGVRHAQQC